MAETEWLLEFLLILLLSGTLFFALRLQRALKVLRGDRTELQSLIDALTKSTSEADASIGRLHAAANGIGRELARHNAEAASLKDDLTYLTERAERLADRLGDRRRTIEKPLTAALGQGRPPEARLGAVRTPRIEAKSEAERELLRALKLAR